MWQLLRSALNQITHFGPRQWLVAFVVVVVVGALCMRGFGSRSSY